MAVSPDVGSRIDRRFDCCDLLHRNVAPKASSVTLTTGMVATPSRGSQGGSLLTWTLIGAVIGGILFGMLSDYYGRVRVLTWTILLFAIFTGLCALAKGYSDLLIYRTIAGLGLGGKFGIGMALVAEAWPARLRARLRLRGARLAGGRARRRAGDAAAASPDRLARHVPGRAGAPGQAVAAVCPNCGGDRKVTSTIRV